MYHGFITFVKEKRLIITEDGRKELEVYCLYESAVRVFEVRQEKLKTCYKL